MFRVGMMVRSILSGFGRRKIASTELPVQIGPGGGPALVVAHSGLGCSSIINTVSPRQPLRPVKRA